MERSRKCLVETYLGVRRGRHFCRNSKKVPFWICGISFEFAFWLFCGRTCFFASARPTPLLLGARSFCLRNRRAIRPAPTQPKSFQNRPTLQLVVFFFVRFFKCSTPDWRRKSAGTLRRKFPETNKWCLIIALAGFWGRESSPWHNLGCIRTCWDQLAT